MFLLLIALLLVLLLLFVRMPASKRAADAVARDAAELGAVLEKHLAGRLCGVDADAVVGQDRRAVPVHAELVCHVLDHRCERRLGRHFQPVRFLTLIS